MLLVFLVVLGINRLEIVTSGRHPQTAGIEFVKQIKDEE